MALAHPITVRKGAGFVTNDRCDGCSSVQGTWTPEPKALLRGETVWKRSGLSLQRQSSFLPAISIHVFIPSPRKRNPCPIAYGSPWVPGRFQTFPRKAKGVSVNGNPDLKSKWGPVHPPLRSVTAYRTSPQHCVAQPHVTPDSQLLGLGFGDFSLQRPFSFCAGSIPWGGKAGSDCKKSRGLSPAAATRRSVTLKDPEELGLDSQNQGVELRSRLSFGGDEKVFAPSKASGGNSSSSTEGLGEHGVNGAPKRRRQTKEVGEIGVKRTVGRRKRTSQLAEVQGGLEVSRGEIEALGLEAGGNGASAKSAKVNRPGVNGVGVARASLDKASASRVGANGASVNGAGGAHGASGEGVSARSTGGSGTSVNGDSLIRASLNGASVKGASVNSDSANGIVGDGAGVKPRRGRRRKTLETTTDYESGNSTMARGGLDPDGKTPEVESSTNGRTKSVRRRKGGVSEENGSLLSSDDDSDGVAERTVRRGRKRGVAKRGSTVGGDVSGESEADLGEVPAPPLAKASVSLPSEMPAPLLPPIKAIPRPPPNEKPTAASFVKEKMRQGLAVVSGSESRRDGEIDNSIDPHRLVKGELVVHKRVGIGRFREMRSEKVEGRAAPVQFVYLDYADGLAKLPAHQAHRLLYRYRSPGLEGKEPGLSKLKDRKAWEKRKSKGRAHIQKMVINILSLYRKRAAISRPVYPRDGEAQARFEAHFKWQPTEHQQQAFDAIRDDMCNKIVPMDRIVCGDVGFGKTEVALRAIFRAANAGRQVAVLAPTTVLAKQHYDVIMERFKDFPEIEVAMLSRLVGDKEKRAGLERIAQGEVDVAVGTHALLSDSVQFNDLGLLIVDEEQRFGVRQKERMKEMKTSIDVLTLSATPIPRTLEQATRGLKDLSLIMTPPPSRQPIKTHLQEMDDNLIDWAIEEELQRGGQVYYVVPRIHGGKGEKRQSILDVAGSMREKMPNVKIDMAHGQMSGTELDRAMRAFRSGETQILLCTSIVESGLDIPNCNTIIITEVEKFGLAQIHQLRGRVGRSNLQAHAYLLYSVGDRENLSPAAELRLQALEECGDLGAGVHVAQRDLTIRGTGEVFGEKQSGKLSTEIGTDLFNEMLFDSLYRAQTETLPKVKFEDVKVDFVVDTLVPHDYIDCTEGRDQFLEDMEKAARGGVDTANEFYLEMEERLGPPPPGAKRRLQMLVMKRLAADLGITRIRTRPKFILFETTMTIGAFQMLFDAIDEEKAVDFKNNLIYKEGSAGFLLKSLLGLPPEKEAQDAFECLLEMTKGLDSFMNLDRS